MSTDTSAVAVIEQERPAPTLRRLPIPVTEPRAALRVVREPEPSGHRQPHPVPRQQVLTLVFGSASDLPDDHDDTEDDGTLPGKASDLDDPHPWVARFVVAALEVAAGARPAHQLVRWTTMEVHEGLARRGALAARLGSDRAQRDRGLSGHAGPGRVRPPAQARPVVRTVRVCAVEEGVYEACAVVADRDRVRAVALRLEGFDGRWRVTVLEIGP